MIQLPETRRWSPEISDQHDLPVILPPRHCQMILVTGGTEANVRKRSDGSDDSQRGSIWRGVGFNFRSFQSHQPDVCFGGDETKIDLKVVTGDRNSNAELIRSQREKLANLFRPAVQATFARRDTLPKIGKCEPG
jgi:hypothetical protein